MKKISIGFVGYGGHAKKIASIVSRFDFFSIDFIYQHHKQKNIDDDYSQLAQLLQCDVIFLTSPNSSHFYYLDWLSKNFDGYIFCEKPPINSLSDIRIFKALDKNKTFFGFNLRYSDFSIKANEITVSQWLGVPISLIVNIGYGYAFKESYKDSWKSTSLHSPLGIVENLGIHYIDLARTILGKLEGLEVSSSNFSKNGDVPDTAVIRTTHQNGASGSIFVSYASPLIESMTLIGTNGLLKYSGDRLESYGPRDTFDNNGMFTAPATLSKKIYGDEDFYLNSLESELTFFLNIVSKQAMFPKILFDQSEEISLMLLKTSC